MKATTLSNTATLSPAQLREAADLSEQIATMTARYNALMSGGIVAGTKSATPKANGKRKFSPAVRARIAAGQKAAWAKRNAAKANPTPAATAPATASNPPA